MSARIHILAFMLLATISQSSMAACKAVPEALYKQFEQLDYCESSRLIAAQYGKRWGYIDANGTMVIPFIYDKATTFNDQGLAVVSLQGRYGMLDRQGQLVVTPQYDAIDELSEVLMPAKLGNNAGYLDSQGKVAIAFNYAYTSRFIDGVAIVGHTAAPDQLKYGFINTQNQQIVPLDYDYLNPYREDFAVVGVGEPRQFGYLNRQGRLVVPLAYDDAYDFVAGMAPVKKGENWGYLGKNGKLAIGLQYEDVWDFVDGLAIVKKQGKYGVINTRNQPVIPIKYDYMDVAGDGKFVVEQAGERFYIDKHNQRVEPDY